MSVESWLAELIAHGRSKTSIAAYRSEMSTAVKTLISMGVGTDPEGISKEVIHRMIPELQVKEDSKRQILRTLGQWVEWETGRNPFKEAKLLWNRPDKKRIFIEKSDFETALSCADARQKLILMLGAKMGLRRVEMSRILLSDISDGRLTVRGKGHQEGKIVSVIIPPSVMTAIEEWMPERSRIGSDAQELLITSIGTPLTPGYIGHILDRLSEQVGVKITPHSLRRLFAMTLYVDMQVDLLDVSKLMRHESVITTQLYLREDRQKLDRIALMV